MDFLATPLVRNVDHHLEPAGCPSRPKLITNARLDVVRPAGGFGKRDAIGCRPDRQACQIFRLRVDLPVQIDIREINRADEFLCSLECASLVLEHGSHGTEQFLAVQ